METGLIQRKILECGKKRGFIAMLSTIYKFLSNQTQFQQVLGLPLVAIPHVPLVPLLQAGYANSPDSVRSTLPTTQLWSWEDQVEMIDRRKKNPSSRADDHQW